MIMNRKGHIGTILMVFGALILVGNALIVMNSFSKYISQEREELRMMSSNSLDMHRALGKNVETLISRSIVSSKNSIDFETDFNASLKAYASAERAVNPNTNLYAKLSLGEYSLVFDGQNYVLEINNLFEQTIVRNNEAVYNYNLRILFDKSNRISLEDF